MLSTINSTKLEGEISKERGESRKTNPLQLMRDPIAPASRTLNPATHFAATKHPPNFPKNAQAIMAMVKPHVIPNIQRQN